MGSFLSFASSCHEIPSSFRLICFLPRGGTCDHRGWVLGSSRIAKGRRRGGRRSSNKEKAWIWVVMMGLAMTRKPRTSHAGVHSHYLLADCKTRRNKSLANVSWFVVLCGLFWFWYSGYFDLLAGYQGYIPLSYGASTSCGGCTSEVFLLKCFCLDFLTFGGVFLHSLSCLWNCLFDLVLWFLHLLQFLLTLVVSALVLVRLNLLTLSFCLCLSFVMSWA